MPFTFILQADFCEWSCNYNGDFRNRLCVDEDVDRSSGSESESECEDFEIAH